MQVNMNPFRARAASLGLPSSAACTRHTKRANVVKCGGATTQWPLPSRIFSGTRGCAIFGMAGTLATLGYFAKWLTECLPSGQGLFFDALLGSNTLG